MSSPESVFSATFPATIRHRRLPTRRKQSHPSAYVGVSYSPVRYSYVGVTYGAVTYHEVTYAYVNVTYALVTYHEVTSATVTYTGVTYGYVVVTYGYVGKSCH